MQRRNRAAPYRPSSVPTAFLDVFIAFSASRLEARARCAVVLSSLAHHEDPMLHAAPILTPIEVELQARLRQQAAVATLGQQALGGIDISTLLDEAGTLVAHTLTVEYCKVLELLPDGTALLLRAGVGWQVGLVGHAMVGAGIDSQAGYALLSATPVIVEDLRTETRFHSPALLHEHGVVSGMSVIIQGTERPWGVLGVHTVRHRSFTQHDVHFLQAIANLLAVAISRHQTEQSLQEREERLHSIIHSAMDAIITIDPDHRITLFNTAAEQMFRCSAAEVIGQSLDCFLPEQYRAVHREHIRRFDQTGVTKRSMGALRPLTALRADGEEFPIEAAISQVTSGGQKLYTVILRDISERMQAYQHLEQRVAERTQELTTLLELSTSVASTLELAPLRNLVIKHLKLLLECSSVALYLVDGDTLAPVENPDQSGMPDAVNGRLQLTDAAARLALIERREPIVIADVHGGTPAGRAVQHVVGAAIDGSLRSIRSWMWIPLVAQDRVLGGLSVTHIEPNRFTQHDAALAMTLANQAAIAMQNIKLYEHAQDLAALQERQRLARELHDAVTQTLFSTSVIADVLPRIWERDPSEGRRNLEDLRQLTRSALAEMRMLLLELRPAELLKLRLPELLTQLVDAMRSRLRVPIALHRRGTCEVPPDVQVMLYRVAQEALNNIAKHAAASEVRVELECTDRGVVLRIGDNGRGFDPRHVPGNHWGVGIMRERAEAVGATLEVCSAWRRGTEITVRWHAPTGAGGV